MTYFGLMLLLIALYCWKASPVYKMQRQEKKARRDRYRCDKRYARRNRA